tara:strand:- start:327 stop:1583 length:1257 start_codon:yes stop_codon:yes gene_type:complete
MGWWSDTFGGGGAAESSDSGSDNSISERIANIFTPNDGASYKNGQLVDDATGEAISAGGTTSTGNVISGSANNRVNDRGALPSASGPKPVTTSGTKNTFRENFANVLTPLDGAKYVNGQLVDKKTGTSLTGGGYSSAGDYIYGVSDDFGNNVIDTSGMSEKEKGIATSRESMLEDLPPGDAAYFASFLPNMVSPLFGGIIGDKMLEAGIDERKSIIDQQVAALERGAKPKFDGQGKYIGYSDPYEDEMEDTFGSGNIYTETTLGDSTYNYGLDDGSGNYRVAMDTSRSGARNPAVEVSTASRDGGPRRDNIYNTVMSQEDYQRRYKGGGMGYGPDYLRRFASGQSIDELVQKVTLPDGTVVYKTPDGRYLDADQFKNTAVSDTVTSVNTGENRVQDGYTLTDGAGNVTRYNNAGVIIG